MIAALIFGLCLVTASLIVTLSNRPRVLEQRARRRMIVTTKGGAAFRGVLWESDAHCLVLRSAQTLPEGVPVDGELLLERGDVETIQIP